MKNISISGRSVNHDGLTSYNLERESTGKGKSKINPALEDFLQEGGDDFFKYLNWTGLIKETNIMVLSSLHHYYYDHNDLKGIKTLVNLKNLNNVRHLESFLHTLFRILPAGAYFAGCFKNSDRDRKAVSDYQSVKFLNGIINIFDPVTERSLSKKGITVLLEEHGFKVIDITEINGISYFWTQNLRRECE
jgi:hypothetical protein